MQAFTAREALEQRDIKSTQLMKWIAVFFEKVNLLIHLCLSRSMIA
ncbi:uncharacterized protein MP3633_0796 [Marinomonas primoryensis]|uniref:Uncharacterized protein n=1 Tax=Marinomonas primoryensis TaxID=178399 RepID=A0A859CUF3_9GAMM|nr:uncharacterized protein MP3633_0796 [Marinomonas primoryensis]